MRGSHFLKNPQCRLEGMGTPVCTEPISPWSDSFWHGSVMGFFNATHRSAARTLARRPMNAKEVLGCFLCRYMQMSMQM